MTGPSPSPPVPTPRPRFLPGRWRVTCSAWGCRFTFWHLLRPPGQTPVFACSGSEGVTFACVFPSWLRAGTWEELMDNCRLNEENATFSFLSCDSACTDASRIQFKCEKRKVNELINCLDLHRDGHFAEYRWRVRCVPSHGLGHTGWSPSWPLAGRGCVCVWMAGVMRSILGRAPGD